MSDPTLTTIDELERREREWSQTELGQLFHRFVKAQAMYWGTDNVTKEICDEVSAARIAFLAKVRGWG